MHHFRMTLLIIKLMLTFYINFMMHIYIYSGIHNYTWMSLIFFLDLKNTNWVNHHFLILLLSDGVDYTLSSTMLTFPNGSQLGARQCVNVSIINDEAVENTESFYIQLSTNDSNVEFSSICNRALFTIYDSDGES